MPNVRLVKSENLAAAFLRFVKRETVLTISATLAAVSIFFVLPSPGYFAYIDYKVLACLFCLMAVVSGLRKTGVFDIAAAHMVRFAGTVRRTALILVGSTFLISMAITNDVALITLIPFSLLLLKDIRNSRSRLTVITLQTIAANIGSSLTPIGNPQNLYLFSFYGMSAANFFSAVFPVVACGGAVLYAAVYVIQNEKIPVGLAGAGANFKNETPAVILYLALFILSVLAVFQVLDYRLATAAVLVTLLVFDRSIFKRIDYPLLFTFVGFFIFIGNLQHIAFVNRLLTSIVDKNVLLVSAAASQAISNVPAAILLSKFTSDYASLLRGVSIGGLGTIIASLASVISYKFFVHEYPKDSIRYLAVFTFWNVLFFFFLYGVCILIG